MSKTKIKVGFIGLNPGSHWAATAHLPALKALSNTFEVVGVANSSLESAERTAEALNLKYAFENYEKLVQSPDIDLVVVTVKVPYHFELIQAALEAGKHVYSEWPLGNGLEEAQKLEALAKDKGVVAAIGTQMRYAPEITYLKQLLEDGFVGKVLSTTLIGTGGNWANETLSEYYYLFDKENGASMLEIPLTHTLVGLTEVLGGIDKVSANMFSNFDQVKITETGEVKPKTTEDQIMLQGRLKSGAALSVHYRGGVSKGTNLLWEINGTEGDIQITADSGHGQMAQLKISGAKSTDEKGLKPMHPSDAVYEGWPKFPGARNIGHIYKRIAEDILTGSHKAPNFCDGLKWHELIEFIKQSAQNNNK
ncbi:Gfo/Idh/MocA family protein [Mangrovimonas futianensis]|uniref:Gfo/Idh/MocA family protein n=1 Tax=Mangrovimonas futianensis TaxID=2895523 RepID=UPI001E3263E3|nr:Gfo/Idh/MocA family oxidoreductase [Mangrovimonas futianensis]MCF1422902.1 Gfo/Idh/MocA family oxidoreductase [Mangrovimonas futianensis]